MHAVGPSNRQVQAESAGASYMPAHRCPQAQELTRMSARSCTGRTSSSTSLAGGGSAPQPAASRGAPPARQPHLLHLRQRQQRIAPQPPAMRRVRQGSHGSWAAAQHQHRAAVPPSTRRQRGAARPSETHGHAFSPRLQHRTPTMLTRIYCSTSPGKPDRYGGKSQAKNLCPTAAPKP